MKTFGLALVLIAIAPGIAAAAAALYGRYRALPAFLTGPTICRLEDNGCQVLFRSPLASLLRVPNSLLGLLYYAAVAVGVAAGWQPGLLLCAATAALAMSSYLAYRLLRDHLECRVCWIGHAANALLWIGLLMATIGANY